MNCLFARHLLTGGPPANRCHVEKHMFMLTLLQPNGTAHLKNVNNYLNANIYSYIETSGGQSCNLHINAVHIFNTSVNYISVTA